MLFERFASDEQDLSMPLIVERRSELDLDDRLLSDTAASGLDLDVDRCMLRLIHEQVE
jgi:hypothetical protein